MWIALASKRKRIDFKTIVLISDGELDEGSNWESILFAPHHKLDNLTLIVDYNKIQSMGNTDDILSLEPLKQKFEAFRWDVCEINGHDQLKIYQALNRPVLEGKPKVIIANTVKGKGVDFMENKLAWHYKSPNEEQLTEALNQIKHMQQ